MLHKMMPNTDEEILAVNNLLLKMREEEYRKERIKYHLDTINLTIADCVEELGLAEAKRIVQKLSKELNEIDTTIPF